MRLACSCSRNTCTSARILPFGASMNCVSSFCTISASEKWPSQSSRMMRPVPSARIAPSGKSTTGASVVPPQRHPAASLGTLASFNSATAGFLVTVRHLHACILLANLSGAFLNAERSRRRPAGLHIGEIKRIQLGPQNVAFVAQRLDGALLLGPRRCVLEHILDGKRRVFGSFGQSRLKIVQPAGQPRIMPAQLLHA